MSKEEHTNATLLVVICGELKRETDGSPGVVYAIPLRPASEVDGAEECEVDDEYVYIDPEQCARA
jgi:hypothetical protein